MEATALSLSGLGVSMGVSMGVRVPSICQSPWRRDLRVCSTGVKWELQGRVSVCPLVPAAGTGGVLALILWVDVVLGPLPGQALRAWRGDTQKQARAVGQVLPRASCLRLSPEVAV